MGTDAEQDDLAAVLHTHGNPDRLYRCGVCRGEWPCLPWRLADRAERAERERDLAQPYVFTDPARVDNQMIAKLSQDLAMSERERDAAQAKVRAVEALLGEPPAPVYDADNPNCPGSFEGHANGRRQDHRTVGTHRAWSDAGEWCYPDQPCSWCLPHIDPADLRDALTTQPEETQ